MLSLFQRYALEKITRFCLGAFRKLFQYLARCINFIDSSLLIAGLIILARIVYYMFVSLRQFE